MFGFKVFDYLHWPMMAAAIVAVIGLFSSIVLAVSSKSQNKPVDLPFLPLFLFLGIGILFFTLSKSFMLWSLTEIVEKEKIEVTVFPEVRLKGDQLLRMALKEIGYKKRSGSHPTDPKWYISICSKEGCIKVEVSSDSRDDNLYWIAYKGGNGSDLPLGVTILESNLL